MSTDDQSQRFDAMLATAMRIGDRPDSQPRDIGADVAAWRQMVDIMAQAGASLSDDLRRAALDRMRRSRDAVPAAERRLAAASLAGRARDADVVALFGSDQPAIAAPLLARVTLDDDDWSRILPAMRPSSRNILRNRRDLSPATLGTLSQFARGDLALTNDAPIVTYEAPPEASPGESPQVATAPGVTQIRDLVDRIEAYRQRAPLPQADAPVEAAVARSFCFETDGDGAIDWVEGCPRGALIGLSIAEPAAFGHPGVDGQAVGAWRRRAPFRDARLQVAGEGAASGDWLMSAAPLFNPHDGRFTGYRGDARRPHAGEQSRPTSVAATAADSLRQIVHELRTPLNAIQGFAQMIDEQLLGPAAHAYRDHAQAIAVEAARLVTMVDDLDLAARLDAERLDEPPISVDLAATVARLVEVHRPALTLRDVDMVVDTTGMARDVAAAPVTVERMIARLIAAVGGVTSAGETLGVAVEYGPSRARFSLTRPSSLAMREAAALLDPDYGPDGHWPDAPLLGLGFTLRLVARLATAAGARFEIGEQRFDLFLPIAAAAQDRLVGPAGLEPAT